jgi:hypothetical protein
MVTGMLLYKEELGIKIKAVRLFKFRYFTL